MHYFYAHVLGSSTSGKIRVLMRSLTNPQIVLITFSYLLGINLNLSWEILNILSERMRCSNFRF